MCGFIGKQKPFWKTFWETFYDVLYKYYWGLVFLNVWIYWKTKTLLENFLRCVIQILWGIGFPKCVDLLENKNPFGKLFGKLFTMCYTIS
jgi:hypothetical protein